ncbi:MAG: hypothetical protein Fur0028_02100 [Bacteroidales bacterium]
MISSFLFYKYKNKIHFGIKSVFCFYFVWVILVLEKFGLNLFNIEQLVTYAGFFILIFSSYFVIVLVDDFFQKFVKIIYYLSIISLPLFFLQLVVPNIIFAVNSLLSRINPSFLGYGGEGYSNSIFFTFRTDQHLYRNCGFSWEPGAFGFFLVIALLIHLTIKSNRNIDKILIVLILTIVTTFSTTAYLGLLVGIIYYNFNTGEIKKTVIYGLLSVPIIIFIVNQSFMKDKIESIFYYDTNTYIVERDIQYAQKTGGTFSANRFASFLIDFRYFISDPLLGRGLNENTRNSNQTQNINYSNGLSDLLVKFGIFGFILYFLLISISIKKLNNLYKIKYPSIVVLGIVIVGFSETLLYTPLLFSIQYFYFKDIQK